MMDEVVDAGGKGGPRITARQDGARVHVQNPDGTWREVPGVVGVTGLEPIDWAGVADDVQMLSTAVSHMSAEIQVTTRELLALFLWRHDDRVDALGRRLIARQRARRGK